MEALLYGSGVESKSETVSIKDTNFAGFSLLLKYVYEGSLPEEANLCDTLINTWPVLLSLTDMYCVERLKLHCASKMWDMEYEKTMTTLLRWAFETNCTQLQEKYMSVIALISPYGILTEDFVFV
ncbi:BTB/POZ and MATH domain-containing protein 1-like [Setaria viridis]|uniref:BTB/POZ and MATH domain-containing protein 1-like n=1 Tax=Setaria viridis TaxID=4556 RepID=UPI003B3BD1A6